MKYIFFVLFHFSLFAEPLSVLIVGGGPAGLATSIEAKMQGCRVKVMEKREAYTRPQTLFLQESSLKLLEKWNVDTSPVKIANLMGFISIRQLEEQLEKRALEIGVEKLFEEFTGEIPSGFDVIVGADGLHSKVREALGIEINKLGTAKGTVLKILDLADTSTEVDISPPIQVEGGFLRRTKVPKASLIFGQFFQNASKETMQKALESQGWENEAKALAEDKAIAGFEIEVVLSQAAAFSNREKSAILVGDAAATASFFQGMGANTALKTAEIAGTFFKEVQENKDAAFQNYEEAVKKLTTEMIEDSSYLFNEKKIWVRRFELPTPCTPCKCASQAALHPDKNGLVCGEALKLHFRFGEFFDGDAGAVLDELLEGIGRGELGGGKVNADGGGVFGAALHALDFEVGEHPLFFLVNADKADELVFCEVLHLDALC